MMKIEQVVMTVIRMPLKKPFQTHLQRIEEREAIILQVRSVDGLSGYGEVVAFSSPWYTEETIQTAFHMLTDFLIPMIKKANIQHPRDVTRLFSTIRGNPMAKSGLETAIWDLFAKQQGLPLWKLIGGVRQQILAGAVVATNNETDALKQIESLLLAGYQRIKVKISPGNDIDLLRSIRKQFPDIDLMADANSAYSLKDIEHLKKLDKFNMLLIEQPLAVNDIVDHALLQRQMDTPICLDESIITEHDAYSAIQLGSCKVMNIKIGRVGGLETAIKIHDLCQYHGIEVWCGGMIEFGISRAHNLAIASLPSFTIPGDIVSSYHYWEEDIIEPMIEVQNGLIPLPDKAGIGFTLNLKRVKEVSIHQVKL